MKNIIILITLFFSLFVSAQNIDIDNETAKIALNASHLAVFTSSRNDEVKKFPNYDLATRYRDEYTGFQAFHFSCQNTCLYQNIFVISGTQSTGDLFDWRDWATNLSFGLTQYESPAAHEFKNDLKNISQGNPMEPVLLTGHSLGGMLAQTMLYELNLNKDLGDNVISLFYASPGSLQLIRRVHYKYYEDHEFNQDNAFSNPSINLAFKKDRVPRIGTQVGMAFLLPDKFTKNIPNTHWTHYIPILGKIIKAHLYDAFMKAIKHNGLLDKIPYSNRQFKPNDKWQKYGEKLAKRWLEKINRKKERIALIKN